MAQDYLAALRAQPDDITQFGIKGMKWGIRNDKSSSSSAPKSTGQAPKAETHIGEDSRDRYARLQGIAKAGRASEMSEPDLKFFNARTDALAKVAKMNESKPGWLGDTTKKVLQTTAQQQMQAVATGIASKYVSGPLINSLNASPETKKVLKEVAQVTTGAAVTGVSNKTSKPDASIPNMPKTGFSSKTYNTTPLAAVSDNLKMTKIADLPDNSQDMKNQILMLSGHNPAPGQADAVMQAVKKK